MVQSRRAKAWGRWLALAVAAAAAAAGGAAWWWLAGCPLWPGGRLFEWSRAHEQDVLCPRRKPDVRDAACVLPAIPHLVTRDGMVPPCRRVRTFTYSTNSGMFRGTREFTREKPPNTCRIVVMGTGVTFGNGVNDDEVYPVLLERALRARDAAGAGRDIEVCNMAVPGSCTDIGLRLLREKVLGYSFDLLVFCYGVNDGLPMFGRSVEQYAATLRELESLVRERGLRVLFMIEPRSSFYPWPYEAYEARFRAIIADGYAIPVLDLPAVLDAEERVNGLRLEREGDAQKVVRYRGGRARTLLRTPYPAAPGGQAVAPAVYAFLDSHRVDQAMYIDGVHLSPAGHARVARELVRFLGEHPALLAPAGSAHGAP